MKMQEPRREREINYDLGHGEIREGQSQPILEKQFLKEENNLNSSGKKGLLPPPGDVDLKNSTPAYPPKKFSPTRTSLNRCSYLRLNFPQDILF